MSLTKMIMMKTKTNHTYLITDTTNTPPNTKLTLIGVPNPILIGVPNPILIGVPNPILIGVPNLEGLTLWTWNTWTIRMTYRNQ